jgi:formyltetrahydrofolate dehydrogenase
MSRSALVHRDGLLLFGCDGKPVNVAQLQFDDGKMIQAHKYGQQEEEVALDLTPAEAEMEGKIKVSYR